MRITIKEIDLASSQLMGNIKAPGYRVRFTSSLATGSAIFVPACSASESIRGESFDVEVNQEGIERFAVEPNSFPREVQITSTEREGDYEIVGVITSIVPRGDNARKAIITISVGDALFVIDSDEIGANYPEEGDWVRFVAREVSLWDEAI